MDFLPSARLGRFISPFRVFLRQVSTGPSSNPNTQSMPADSESSILFAAFEPSGDALAAPVIAALRSQRPPIPIWAFGGPLMRNAGAKLIEETTNNAVMSVGAAARILEHRRRLAQLRRWLQNHDPMLFVPVDSPAANWAICKLVRRRHNCRIIHLAAPQIWAWAPWRIAKLRRLTDHVLCLLPFEPEWFATRGVRASFVGHPAFLRAPSTHPLPNDGADLDEISRCDQRAPGPTVKKDETWQLALLPGSRKSEVIAHWPMMIAVFDKLRSRYPQLHGTVAARSDDAATLIAGLLGRAGHNHITIRTGEIEQVLDQADLALVVSGTATLQVAASLTPMVVVYNVRPLLWHLLGRWIIQTRTFTLPNLIAAGEGPNRIVPEFVPHFGQVDPVVRELDRLIRDHSARQAQLHAFDSLIQFFLEYDFAGETARIILDTLNRT